MIQSFYTWIWYPFSLYCYHLITVPGMRMFPPRWKLTGWRRALAWFAAAMVSGFLAQILRLGVLALLKITGWPDTFFFQQICHLAALGLVCGVFYKGSLVTKLLVINLALALANQLAFIYGTVMLMVLGPEYSVWMILLRDVLSFSAFGYFYHALRVNTVAGNLFLARRDQICLLAIVFLNFTLSCSARGFLMPLPATVFYVSGCLTTIAITFLLFRYAWEHQRAKEQQTLLQDMRLSQSALSQIQETAAQMREMRHELGNHFVYISSMLEQKQYDELASYLSTMETWQDALAQAVATANPVANAVINGKLSSARSLGIRTRASVSLPQSLPLDDLSLCSLLGNLLNNAIEACQGTSAPDILLRIGPMKSYLVFRLENTVDHDVLKDNPELRSTKPDEQEHGFGMRVIRRIVQSHKGILRCEMIEEDRFCVQVMLML